MNNKTLKTYSYLAGLVDGEGSLYITKSRKNNRSVYSAGIKVAMNDKQGLILFQKTFGGKIVKGSRKLDKRTNKLYAPAWVLQYRAKEDVEKITLALKPFLEIKKKQADIILDFLQAKKDVLDTKFQQNAYLNNKYRQSRASKKQGWDKVLDLNPSQDEIVIEMSRLFGFDSANE